MKPLHSSVILTDEKVTKSKSIVLSVGPMCMSVKATDVILTPRYADEFILDNISYMICKEEEITAKF